MGHMNTHSPLWYDKQCNDKGLIFERLVLDKDIVIMKDGSTTHYFRPTDSTSIIDLTICSSDCCMDFSYSVNESLHSSDHCPIHLELINNPTPIEKYPCFITKRANWSLFTQLTEVYPLHQFDSAKLSCVCVTAKLVAAAIISIPRRSKQMNRPPVPWWSGQCYDAKRESKSRKGKEEKQHRRD